MDGIKTMTKNLNKTVNGNEDRPALYSRFTSTALRVTLLYLLFGLLWVLFSDKLIFRLILNKQHTVFVSMIKGWFYVMMSSGLVYLLIRSSLTKMKAFNQKLVQSYNELASWQDKLQDQLELLTESEERYRLITQASNDGIWIVEKGEKRYSDSWYEMTGYTKEEMDAISDWKNLIHPEDVEVASRIMVNKDMVFRDKYRIQRKDGSYFWVLSTARIVFDDQGNVIRGAGSITNINDLIWQEQKLKQLAYEDYLTNLPNRTAFYENVARNLAEDSDSKKSLMFIDIDNFKYVNDTLGHVNGDKLILEIGKRLSDLAGDDESVYRIGGDEFIVFIHQYEEIDELKALAEKLLQAFNAPFKVAEYLLNITVSVGIVIYPDHGQDVDTLLKCADMAMYQAKSTAHGAYVFYNQIMDIKFKQRMLIEYELRRALELQEFNLLFQPQIDIGTGAISSVEALLRWNNSKLGTVPPDKFISVAEETTLINPIGDWVLVTACEYLKQIRERGHRNIVMSVNISIIQLMQQNFTQRVLEVLEQMCIPPQYLELEMTESMLIESYDVIREKVLELRSYGIKIALDDFGKGYSSLSHLNNIPINTLKIDKTFIDTIDGEEDVISLTGMIIMIGHRLGMTIVAEGVEREEQFKYLQKHQCNKIQGYYFSKPLPCNELSVLLSQML